MANLKEVTYKDAGLTKENVYTLIFNELVKHQDGLDTKDIYEIINNTLAKNSQILSEQGRASLRNLINKYAVLEGFIFPYDNENPKWRLTSEGKKLIEQQGKQKELVFNIETNKNETEMSNTLKGTILEKYVLGLLKEMHPYYS